MSTFNPELTIQAHDAGAVRTYRFSFYLPRGDGFVARGKMATLMASPGDSVEVDVRQDAVSQNDYRVVVCVGGSQIAELGIVSFSASPTTEQVNDLLDAVQRAFFTGMNSLSISAAQIARPESMSLISAPADIASPADVMAATGAVIAPNGRKWHDRVVDIAKARPVMSMIVLLAAGLVVYGTLFSAPKPKQDGLLAGQDYSELNAKIREQITAAVNSKEPAATSLQGQNVALETMKAMGLDPGKANAGCLVGVQ